MIMISIRNQLSSEDSIVERLQTAIQTNDSETLKDLLRFAPDFSRTLALNFRTYEAAVMCGYQPEIKFDRNGWFVMDGKEEREEKCERLKYTGKSYSIELLILQHPNGKWVTGHEISFSMSGSLAAPSIFADQYDTRTEAVKAKLDTLIAYVESSTNDKEKREAMKQLKRERAALNQLSLF